jgi:diguanylate cyclase (GGDEF)-like protein
MDEPRSPPSEEAELEDLRGRVERLSAALDAARAEAAQLEALAHEDALTGILNRRGFLRDLTRALAYGSRYNAPAALLICDLDAFKLVNDRYGHPVGDRALRHAADLLRAHIRTSDSVGRLGGDEFALVIWQVDSAQAEHKARTIEDLIAAEPLALDRRSLRLGASVGFTLLRADDGPDEALARADRALYARKAERGAR